MTELNRYRLSLHVSHPSIAVSDIVRHFAFPVRYSKSVGEERKTKMGRLLGGVYSKTDISFDVSGEVIAGDEASFCECLQSSFNGLPFDAIRDFVLTGGECFYLAGIYAENNYMLYFKSDLLFALSSSLIGLKLDFYGGKDSF